MRKPLLPWRFYGHIIFIIVMLWLSFDERGLIRMPLAFFTVMYILVFFWDLYSTITKNPKL